ncbi:MAG: hypothetical protein Q9228_004959 [Teloschistes exilis]
MADKKRKVQSADRDSRPTKKPKSSTASSKVAVVPAEEPSFPRGGASILTPLEQKQIQIQAKNDVLFEQETGKKAPRREYEDEENETDTPAADETSSGKTRKKSKHKARSGNAALAAKEKAVRIEGLSYRRLVPGTLVLGQVSQINQHDIALSLPNNLTGYIPITSISDRLTEIVEKKVEDQEDDKGEAEDKDMNLSTYFYVGQYLRASVISTEKEAASGSKGKRHIELSINPRKANAGLRESDFIVDSMVQASVKSVEDHGLIMDLGIDGHIIKGFMSSKETGKEYDLSSVQEGAVFLCLITGLSSNGNVVKLSADTQKAGHIKKRHFLTDAPNIDCFLPGTAIEILMSDVTSSGVIGKAMGVLDVTADVVHAGAMAASKELEKKYTVGEMVKARVICTYPDAEPRKLGISLLDHVLSLKSNPIRADAASNNPKPIDLLPISTIVPEARVVKVEPGIGLMLDMGVKGIRGYVHISRIFDGKIETLAQDTGPYKMGSVHKARVTGYNYMDGLYIVSMEPKVIAQTFLSIDDVQVGQVVKGTIEKLLINETGVNGLIVAIAEGITGLVPEIHFSDIHLQHPEKKFKVGASVTTRVLSTVPLKRQMRLTLKKSLVNSDDETWTSYDNLQIGAEAPGTIISMNPSGAVVQFYGPVRGFLPSAEMSESYVEDPKKHFRIGQVVKVWILSLEVVQERMIVSCRDPSAFGAAQQEQIHNLAVGSLVTGTVSEKANDEMVLELQVSRLKAILPFEHLTDGSSQKSSAAAKKVRVGQDMKDLVVLSKAEGKRLIHLTSKPSLVSAATSGQLIASFEDVREGVEIAGYVSNIKPIGVFVQFAGRTSGLLPKSQLPDEAVKLPDFGMRKHESISARVLSINYAEQRFVLTQKPDANSKDDKKVSDGSLTNPIDEVSTNMDDFCLGKLTKAKIDSVKLTQLNVHLADGVQGRIDMSEAFDKMEDIKDRKNPLKLYRPSQVLLVRILGMHDSRNHKFLPITHRGKAPVFELSAKPSDQTSTDFKVLTLDQVHVGSTYLVFVNNVGEDYVWVSLSPNVRGRIKALDLSDDVTLLKDLEKNFSVGRALEAEVISVDTSQERLDLKAKSRGSTKPLACSDLSIGTVLPGKVIKVNERQVLVQLSESLTGMVNLVDLSDDYSRADPTVFKKNQIDRFCIRHIDALNKRVYLSARPSKVLSSSLPVIDREIRTTSDIQVNDVIRGFIRNMADNGIFVNIGSNLTAFVRISDLSDLFLKDWKSDFEIDQLVEGKVYEIDVASNHVRMSLKKSHVDSNYQPPLTFNDMTLGQVVTGKVRKVEDFGVFVVVDNSANVSGLCHRTQMADGKSAKPQKLYSEGDLVKAKILKIDRERKRISLGLKASYFNDDMDADVDGDDKNVIPERAIVDDDDDGSSDGMGMNELEGMPSTSAGLLADIEGREDEDGADSDTKENTIYGMNGISSSGEQLQGLDAGGFDWIGGPLFPKDVESESDTDMEASQPKKKKRRKAEIQIDRTGDLDANGPQSEADYERLLLGQPNSSVLWLSYMAFQLQSNETEQAMEIGERALRTIHIREQDEKLNVWVAMLNLENTYGTDESLDEVFKRACQYCDSLDIHERLISIYIQSGKQEKADALFTTALSKHGSQSPSLWLNAATFFLSTLNEPSRARQLLPRALQSLPPHTHLQLTSQFAQLEFTSPNGDPERGRTAFEGLLTTFPKRLDLWNVLIDLEIKTGEVERVRELFGRVTKLGLKAKKMKYWFKRWMEWEEKCGGERERMRVRGLAEEYVRRQMEERGKVVEV